MNKLPIDFKQKWVAALRSEQYEQTNALLYNRDNPVTNKPRMCCLGVACDIVGMNRENLFVKGTPNDVKTYDNFDKLPTYIKVIDQIKYDENKEGGKLANFNDNGKSFDWIADYIENNL